MSDQLFKFESPAQSELCWYYVDKRYELQGLQLMDVSDADFEARFVSELIEYMNSTDNENRTEEIADIIIQGYTLLKKKGLNPEKIIISKLRKNLHKPL